MVQVTNLSVTAKADTDIDMTTGTAAQVTVALSGTRSEYHNRLAAITNVSLTDTSSNVITVAAATLVTVTLQELLFLSSLLLQA